MIKLAVDLAKAEGFPASVEDKEAFFLDQVSKGEALANDRECPFSILSLSSCSLSSY